MATIRVIAVDAEVPGRLALTTAAYPSAALNEALVRVQAISLNRGEVRGAQNARQGSRPGWDIAGFVEEAAADGSGPKQGDRVVGLLRTGAWAEVVAVPATNLALLSDSVSFQQASTLPVAGLTALYALDRAQGLSGRKVLITGASGGVGHLGVQIAVDGGATVTGLVRQEKHIDVVQGAGAQSVVADETGAGAAESGPFHHVLESVGGQVLGNVLGMVAPFGQVVCYGMSGGGPTTFDSGAVLRSRLTLSGLAVFTEINRETAAVGLGRLVRMVEAGTLAPHIAIEAPWDEVGEVAQQLLDRSYPGKAVLTVS
jgi:NADPH:quinone reductase-like Zn-dependent oxidoreductase